MRVGIIGAGPAGSYLAYLLAKRGVSVILFDKFETREKPCGGGVTYKALDSFDIFSRPGPARTYIRRLKFTGATGDGVELPLEKPLCIFSRRELDHFICQTAMEQGVTFIIDQVTGLAHCARGWAIKSKARGVTEVDFLVGADGAKSLVRATLSKPFSKHDLSLTLGYYVPGEFHRDTAICRFMGKDLRGYMWSFPRADHLSVGIISDLGSAQSARLKILVEGFIREHYPDIEPRRCRFFSAVVPELTLSVWAQNQFYGETWALVGDAAGFVDPITGEGIYYSLRSAELCADALLKRDLTMYARACTQDFVKDLAKAAQWKAYFGNVFTLISRVALGSWRSRTLRKFENDFISGNIDYLSSTRGLLKAAPQIVGEILRSKIATIHPT